MPAGSDGLLWVRELVFATLVGIARSSYQAWESDDLLTRPANGAYTQTHVVEAVLLAELRSRLPVPAVRNAMRGLRADGLLENITDRFRSPSRTAYLDLVIEADIGGVAVCFSERELLREVRRSRLPRTLTIVPLSETLTRSIAGFHNNAESGAPPTKRARGRPSSSRAEVTALRRGP